jgi:hypothetical protein
MMLPEADAARLVERLVVLQEINRIGDELVRIEGQYRVTLPADWARYHRVHARVIAEIVWLVVGADTGTTIH